MLRLTFIMVFICGISYGQNNKPKFRNTDWGMTKSEVKEVEEAELIPIEGTNGRQFTTSKIEVGGLPCKAVYKFSDNKLTSGAYNFIPDYTNKNEYIKDYTDLKKLLRKKYDEPKNCEVNFRNDLYKNDRSMYGYAIQLGQLTLFCNFEERYTDIQLNLFGKKRKIYLRILYYSKRLKELEETINDQNSMEDL